MGSGISFYIQAERIKGKAAPDNVHYREWYVMPGGQQRGHVDDDIRKQHAEEYRSWKRHLADNLDMLKGAALEGLEKWEKEGGVPVDQLLADAQLRGLEAPELNSKKDEETLKDPYVEKKEALEKEEAEKAKTKKEDHKKEGKS